MPGGVVLAEPDWPMCAKLLSADGPAEASSVVCASLCRGLEALAGRRAGRCGGCDSAAQAARQQSTSALRMLVSYPTRLADAHQLMLSPRNISSLNEACCWQWPRGPPATARNCDVSQSMRVY